MDAPRSTRGAPPDQLLELVQLVRRELVQRDEAPSGAWVEATANDLSRGDRWGAYYPAAEGGGLAFRSDRGNDSFGHVHVGRSDSAAERAQLLAEALLDSIPPAVTTVSVGFTGLTVDEEARALGALARRPGSTVIRRFAMDRALGPEDGTAIDAPPTGVRTVPIRDITLDALADLDWRAFEGSVDALLIGRDVREYRRVLQSILDGESGRFLDEASTALYRADPPALLSALLTCEKSARRASFLDFMVDPATRRSGYGRYLLRWGFRALRALGYEQVRLWVSESNVAARRLYDSAGFSVTLAAAIYRWDRPGSVAHPQTAA
jgi:ribosomal protein S18 acetylase RimI-like enzyme